MADNTVHNGRLVSNKPSIFDEKQVSKHSERQRHAGSAISSWWKQHSKGTKFMTTFSKCLFLLLRELWSEGDKICSFRLCEMSALPEGERRDRLLF